MWILGLKGLTETSLTCTSRLVSVVLQSLIFDSLQEVHLDSNGLLPLSDCPTGFDWVYVKGQNYIQVKII